ncbi:DUF433 domain-containing protein [Halovenus sp. HT40]|uniref:DUF433 domain-containing protein n=1 Tax=Halovenus sp. HT40 TaxID=3126691 RepID=UPI00300F019D
MTSDRIETDLMDVPHVVGRRISVIQIYRQITDGEWTVDELAEDLRLDPEDVHAAVEYYQTNHQEMEMLRERMDKEKTALRDQIAARRPDQETPEAVPVGHGLGEPTVDRTPISEMSDEEIEELHTTSDSE